MALFSTLAALTTTATTAAATTAAAGTAATTGAATVPGVVAAATPALTQGGAIAGASTGIGTALQVGGLASQAVGAFEAQSASAEAEAIRRRQMRFEAARRRRSVVREAFLRRSQAINQAAIAGGGEINALSSLPTAIDAGTVQPAATEIGAINTAETFGERMFDANAASSIASGFTSMGTGVQNLGKMFLDQNVTLAKLFQTESQDINPISSPVTFK